MNDTKTTKPDEENKALEREETALRVEQDSRVERVKSEGEAGGPPKKSETGINPDG